MVDKSCRKCAWYDPEYVCTCPSNEPWQCPLDKEAAAELERHLKNGKGMQKMEKEKCCYDCVFCIQSNAPLEVGVQYECANFNSKRYIEISIDPWDKACGDFSGGGEDVDL